jgi:hypothetical protein
MAGPALQTVTVPPRGASTPWLRVGQLRVVVTLRPAPNDAAVQKCESRQTRALFRPKGRQTRASNRLACPRLCRGWMSMVLSIRPSTHATKARQQLGWTRPLSVRPSTHTTLLRSGMAGTARRTWNTGSATTAQHRGSTKGSSLESTRFRDQLSISRSKAPRFDPHRPGRNSPADASNLQRRAPPGPPAPVRPARAYGGEGPR